MAGIAGKIEEGTGVLILIAIGAIAFVLYGKFANAQGAVSGLFDDLAKVFGGGGTSDAIGTATGVTESIANFPDYVFGSKEDQDFANDPTPPTAYYKGEDADPEMDYLSTPQEQQLFDSGMAALDEKIAGSSTVSAGDLENSVYDWAKKNRLF